MRRLVTRAIIVSAAAGLLMPNVALADGRAMHGIAPTERSDTAFDWGDAMHRPNQTLIAQDEPVIRGLDKPPGQVTDVAPVQAQAEDTFGVTFLSPEKLTVQQPILKALIQLNPTLSPYQLDARTARAIELSQVLRLALANNLTIKISGADMNSARWTYLGSLGAFLPTLNNSFVYETIGGKYSSPFGLKTRISSPNMNIVNGISQPLFTGGQLLFTAAQMKHTYRAAQQQLRETTNEILYDSTSLYYDLVKNDVLLQIRIKAVETSTALLARNEDRFANGAATKLDVLEARTQLSRDRQALVTQQIARRKSALKLANRLNLDTAEDLLVENRTIAKIRLVDGTMDVGKLLQIAIDNRPELKKYEELRIAAKDAVRVAFAPLLPQVNGIATAATTGALVGNRSSSSGGMSAPSTGGLAVGGFSPSSGTSIGGSSGPRKFRTSELFLLGINMNWTLGGLGTVEAAKVQAAKWQARKAQLEFSKALADVYQDVRDAYLDIIQAENLIAETTEAVDSAREQLDVSNTRLEEGVGTYLEAINAQRDYTQALIDKCSAIVSFNVAQAKLLKSMGRVSLSTLTSTTPVIQ